MLIPIADSRFSFLSFSSNVTENLMKYEASGTVPRVVCGDGGLR